jgi:hypothetical protein
MQLEGGIALFPKIGKVPLRPVTRRFRLALRQTEGLVASLRSTG